MGESSETNLRDMSRKFKTKGVRTCPVCGLPFVFLNLRKQFCTPRCRQRRHRGHVTTATIRRTAAGYFAGHLSDRVDADFSN